MIFSSSDPAEARLELSYSKQTSGSILAVSLLCVLINIAVLCSIYKRRSLRSSCTAIIVCNLACVDIFVTMKDIPYFLDVLETNQWRFVDDWCQMNGLTSVIFIIVSVSTLATIASERFTRLRSIAVHGSDADASVLASHNPLMIGYVISHTTLSYSLSLMWSKYVFVARKAACRVDWPPHSGFTVGLMGSFVFVIPVSALVYNVVAKNIGKESHQGPIIASLLQQTKQEISDVFEERAQTQIHKAVTIFLCSWTPYVLESILSSYFQISPNAGLFVAILPLVSTSLLPLYYVSYVYPRMNPSKVVVQ